MCIGEKIHFLSIIKNIAFVLFYKSSETPAQTHVAAPSLPLKDRDPYGWLCWMSSFLFWKSSKVWQ